MNWLSGFAFAALIATGAQAQEAPNFVVILADDLGYGEVGARHVGDVATPNIDAIAREGVTFTNGYISGPLCTPSRAGLLTGRYPQEFGIYRNPPNPPPANFGLPGGTTTLAEALRDLDYATGMVGKWHLGSQPEDHPQRHGFDEFFGVLKSSHPYFGEQAGNPILRGTTPVPASGYLTDTFAAEAAKFISEHADRPFFLYVPFTATHRPLQAKNEVAARLSHIRDPNRRLFAAVLASLDEGVGTIAAAVRAAGIAQNTVIVFLGDNGCLTRTTCRNTPLRASKGSYYEGGIRVPFILSWPERLSGNRIFEPAVISTDLFATFVRAGGGSPGRVVDGIDLLPFLRDGGTPHPTLFWGGNSFGSTRRGNWKLIGNELYDLSLDIGETRNRAGENPSVVADLRLARTAWLATLAPPLW